MKKISILFASMIFAGASFAATTTSLSANWVCTTNASSSSVEAEQAADKDMAENAKSAAEAYALATKNCRDCTKITCSVNE